MVTYHQRYWHTVERTFYRTYKQRYWHTRVDGVRQRYWHKVRIPYRKVVRQRYWHRVTRRPRVKPEVPLWRVHGGYTTTEGITPTGNVRVVKYVESWGKPEEPSERWARKVIQNTSGQFEDGTKMGNWVDQLTKSGGWSTEVEKVDRVELPAGYTRGRWYVEVFRARGGPPEGVPADYWRDAYGAG